MEKFVRNKPVGYGLEVSERPLVGLTILLVEDSRYFSDAVRLLAIGSGARLRRADCLRSARKHIQVYRPDVVLVDLGLPDGSGMEFIKELVAISPTGPSVIAMSGASKKEDSKMALENGAQCFLEKPFFNLASFQQTILSVLKNNDSEQNVFIPRVVGEHVRPDRIAFQEDLVEIEGIFSEALRVENPVILGYCVQFIKSVARVAQDKELMVSAHEFSEGLERKKNWRKTGKILQKLVLLRLSQTLVN